MSVERRHLPQGHAAVRASGGANGRLDGYASVFEAIYAVGEFDELVERGAFAGVLGDPVAALFNHDPDHLLGDVASGTLRLSEDETGLRYVVDMGDVDLDRFILDRVRRRMLTGSSFSFSVRPDGESWGTQENGRPLRRIRRLTRLFDVGPVTFPASESTVVAARAIRTALMAHPVALAAPIRPLSYYRARQRQVEAAPSMSGVPAPTSRRAPDSRSGGPWHRRYPNLYRRAVETQLEGVRTVAVHEAGHAVAAILEGKRIKSAGLRWAERDGRWILSGGLTCFTAPPRSRVVALAGMAAVRMAGMSGDVLTDRSDLDTAGLAETNYLDVRDGVREAEDAIGPHRHVVDLLAERLIEECQLDGETVEQIVLGALEPYHRDRALGARVRR